MKHFLLALFVCSAAAYAADTPVLVTTTVHAPAPIHVKAPIRAKRKARLPGSAPATAPVIRTAAVNSAAPLKSAGPLRNATVSQCFKVVRLLKSDAAHYWADWANTCPYTIDAVYVMVGFLDGGHNEMGNGVWPMYFVQPGVHRVTRFSAPLEGFETVRVHRITSDSAVALADPGKDPAKDLATDHTTLKMIEAPRATLPPGQVGDTGMGRVISYDLQIAGDITENSQSRH